MEVIELKMEILTLVYLVLISQKMNESALIIQNWWRNLNCCTSCEKHSYHIKYIIQDRYFCNNCFNNELYKLVLELCYCNSWFCNHDCGALACGCIDICRKKHKLFSKRKR